LSVVKTIGNWQLAIDNFLRGDLVMKSFQTKLSVFVVLLVVVLLGVDFASGQVRFPRPSQRAMVSQTIGITDVSISYHRPGVKGRQIWGCTAEEQIPPPGKTYPCLVPNNQVWRMGANEATVFEISEDIMINGQKLTKGKYSLHAIPSADMWTIIINKDWGQWGSFRYDEKQDALRLQVKPETAPMQEWLIYEFGDVWENKATLSMRWEKVKINLTIDVGDVNKTTLTQAQAQYLSLSVNTANHILTNKMKDNYGDALKMLDAAISIRETYGNLNAKARLLAEMGNFKEAVMVGEKAVQVGKAANANTAAFEKTVADWKQKTQ
jgi:hypothetical protein